MSGIGVILHLTGAPVLPRSLLQLMAPVAHRAVDGLGTWTDGAVGMAFGLLSTLPTSAPHPQPLTLGQVTVALDGRIDNRPELMAALAPGDGLLSDAELVALAYRRWGTQVAAHLMGDFALALWDATRERLVCARDHIGIRLLHYYYDGQRFIAATEIKQLLGQPGVRADLNIDQIRRFLELMPGAADETCYRHIRRLPAGHTLVVDQDGLRYAPYWRLEPAPYTRRRRPDDYVDEFRSVFGEAVRARAQSCGPLGIMVSGGVDSTSVYATARRMAGVAGTANQAIHAFSWAFPDIPSIDETRYARHVLGPNAEVSFIDGSNLWSLKEDGHSGATRDEPYTAPHEALLRATFRRANAEGVRALLTGQGGELCNTGMSYLVDLVWGLRWTSLWRAIGPLSRRGKRMVAQSALAAVAPSFLSAKATSSAPWLRRWTAAPPTPPSVPGGAYLRHRRTYVQAVQTVGSSPWAVWADQTTAEFGLEMRHPFWDVRVVELLARVPPEVTFHPSWSKILLRRAMSPVLPGAVCWRRDKTSLYPLFDRGLAQMEAGRLERLTKDMRLADLGLVEPETLQTAYRDYRAGDTRYRDYFWATFVTEEWLRSLTEHSTELRLPQAA